MREGGVTPQLTHSEYLKDILSSSNSAIITFILNSAITGKSVEGFKNFLSNNKIKTIQEDFDLYKNLIENIQFKAGVPNKDSNYNKYKKLYI